jgi:hypothetical protein
VTPTNDERSLASGDGDVLTIGRDELDRLLGLDDLTSSTANRHVRRFVDEGAFAPLNPWARPDRWRFSTSAVRTFIAGNSTPSPNGGPNHA